MHGVRIQWGIAILHLRVRVPVAPVKLLHIFKELMENMETLEHKEFFGLPSC